MFDGAVSTLCNVKHILDLRKNLISLDTLDYNGFSFKSSLPIIASYCGWLVVMSCNVIVVICYALYW
jgi:hypothetical protein